MFYSPSHIGDLPTPTVRYLENKKLFSNTFNVKLILKYNFLKIRAKQEKEEERNA